MLELSQVQIVVGSINTVGFKIYLLLSDGVQSDHDVFEMIPFKLICCCAVILKAVIAVEINDKFSLEFSNDGFDLSLILNKDCQQKVIADLSHGLNKRYELLEKIANKIIVRYPGDITFEAVSKEPSLDLVEIELRLSGPKNETLMMCADLGDAHWYGGPQQKHQYWPIEKLILPEYSYLPKEADNAGIAEPYWLNSEGLGIYVDERVPLFVDQNNHVNNSVCFVAQIKAPYSSKRERNNLILHIVWTPNAKTTHKHIVKRFLKKPSGIPDVRMIEHPIWSTWAEYKAPINESIIMDFANKILKYDFNNSQLEIDDLWETCYGSFNVDTNKFPDLRGLNRRLKEMGFRVTFWIHPFINEGCEPWYSEALNKGYFVKSEDGNVKTSWWNSVGPTASYVDFTNEEAVRWWMERLEKLQETYEIDSFKFDAGETSWSPTVAVQRGDINTHPSHITQTYVRNCAKFGPMVEVRSGIRTQDLPIFVRMIDKDSEWNFENGIPTLITTLLQMNMNGYPLVLPDMIGGNGYNGAPNKELFIRWLQANVFMPSLQYSYVPWDYDDEAIAISRYFSELHANYTDKIVEAMKRAVMDGTPVNPPIWWIDPEDQTALGIWDEFLLGEDILVAPILDSGAIKRDVYLPKGTWLAEGQSNRVLEGGQWIKNYSAPLNALPYFIKIQ